MAAPAEPPAAAPPPQLSEQEARERVALQSYQAGQACLGAGRADEALPHLMRAAAALPGWPEAWLGLGLGFQRLRHYGQACGAMHRGLELCAWEDLPSVLTYMDTLRELGRLSAILEAAVRIPKGHPLRHFAALLAGWAAHGKEGAEAAAAWWLEANEAAPGPLYGYLARCASDSAADCTLPPLPAEDDEEALRQLQRAQHHLDVPGLRHLNDKVELHRILEGQDFRPPGFVLPTEQAQAEAADGPGLRWLRKRRNGMGGQGLSLHESAADAAVASSGEEEEEKEEFLLQQLLTPPVLLSGRRFTLRSFLVLYVGEGGVVGYLAREALVLMAAKAFAEESGDLAAHITNQSAAVEAGQGEGLTRDLAEVADEELEGWPEGKAALWAAAHSAACGLLERARPALLRQVGELDPKKAVLVPKILGLDLLLTTNSEGSGPRLWLLEVNRHPSLGEHYACAKRVKRRVQLDAWGPLLQPKTGSGGEEPCRFPQEWGCLRRLD